MIRIFLKPKEPGAHLVEGHSNSKEANIIIKSGEIEGYINQEERKANARQNKETARIDGNCGTQSGQIVQEEQRSSQDEPSTTS